MNDVSHGRRALTRSLLAAPLAVPAGAARAQPREARVLRYAFRVAETGFDPAQVNDLYSSTINANILTRR